MTVHDLMNELMEIKQYSNVLYNGAVVAVTTIQPNTECILTITLDSSQTGSVYITGSTTETVAFTSDLSAKSSNLFTSITGVSPIGLSGYMTITANSEDNVPVNNLILKESFYGYFKVKTNKDILMNPGTITKFDAYLYTEGEVNIANNDIIMRKENRVPTYYVVDNLITVSSYDGNSHKEMTLEKTTI